jgi:hypothetical protein
MSLRLDIDNEIARQDAVHPSGYPATRDGVFLGITTAVHELDREAVDAWRSERCNCSTPTCGHATWPDTRTEIIQAVAVLLRTLRSIDTAQGAP